MSRVVIARISMVMRDANTKTTLWIKRDWHLDFNNVKEEATDIPAQILQCDAVSREIEFFSADVISDFQMQQKVFLRGTCIEQWKFSFGFVIPGSTNSWEQTIYAAPPEHMLSATQVRVVSFVR
jgi:retinal rod rhodopsin-sensitive cGMP 3',5'-cyclic phosphodiesterase subunit delta